MTRLTASKKRVKGTEVKLEGTPLEKGQSLHSVRLAIAFFFAMICAVGTRAQDAASPKLTLFAGPGIVPADGNSRGEIQAGASFDEAPPSQCSISWPSPAVGSMHSDTPTRVYSDTGATPKVVQLQLRHADPSSLLGSMPTVSGMLTAKRSRK
jgi:hypothetical protein